MNIRPVLTYGLDFSNEFLKADSAQLIGDQTKQIIMGFNYSNYILSSTIDDILTTFSLIDKYFNFHENNE